MEENQALIGRDDQTSYDNTQVTPRKRSLTTYKSNLPLIFVLATETAERFAFYGLLCNMALSLNSHPFNWSSYNAVHAIMIFNGISYFMTVFGGWVADSLLGKFWTITIFFFFYATGYSVWSSFHGPKHAFNCTKNPEINLWCDSTNHSLYNSTSPCDSCTSLSQETCSTSVFLALAVIGIGYGCVRVNIVPFGAQQVERKGRHSLRVYFNWLYWCINVGSFLAYGVLGYVQQEISYFYGYLAPLCVLILAWGIFLSGTRFYTKKFYIEGSPLKDISKVVLSCLKNSCSSIKCKFSRSNPIGDDDGGGSQNLSCLDRASSNNGGDCTEENVRNTRAFLKIFVIFLCLVPYWTVYYQMQTTFLIQGLHMKLDFVNTSENMTLPIYEQQPFKIAASWLSISNILFVILIVPFLDRVVYPFLDSKQCSPTVRFRILLGMFFSTAAMCVAGGVERIRLKTYWGDDNAGHPHIQYIACTKYYAADMSIFWQIPQYILIAVSEVFTSIAGLEMAYICAPKSIQSIVMGIFYCSQGLGSILGTVVMLSLESVWFSYYDHGNINCKISPFLPGPRKDSDGSCHLDYYFYVLAGIQSVGIILFSVLTYVLEIGSDVPVKVRNKGIVVKRNSQDGRRTNSSRE